MANLRLWWQIQTDRLGLSDPTRPAPAMNHRVAAGFMTFFAIVGTSQLALVVLEVVSGRDWGLRAVLSGTCLLGAAGYFFEWRRAKRLAEEP